MMKEIFEIANTIISKCFDMSVNKRNQETDLNIKTLNMVKENNLSPILIDIVEERQIKLLTGKNVNVRFAEKIQKLKIQLGGNFTNEQLYSIEKFYKEDENGELYIVMSKKDIFLTQFFGIFILTMFCLEVILLSKLTDQINNIQNLILYISTIILSGIICFILLSLKSNEFTAIYIKRSLEAFSR